MNLDAVIFVPALTGSVIVGFAFLMFAAHYYLSVLEGTAAGAKEIPWEGDAITNNFIKVFYLAWLMGLWAGPAYFVGRTIASGSDATWIKLAAPLLVIWVLYPLSQLASLSASSVWVPMNLDVFARLAQKPLVTVGFFALTLPVFALIGIAFKWAYMTRGEFPLLFMGVPLLCFAVLLYARLLGRLAFALMFTKNLFKRKKKKKPKREVEEFDAEPDAEDTPPLQPSEMAPINTPDGELAGYNVLMEDDPPAPKKRVKAIVVEDEPEVSEPEPVLKLAPEPPPLPAHVKPATDRPLERTRVWDDEDDDTTPYTMNPSEVKDEERIPQEVVKPRADEVALLDRRDAPKPPKVVWSWELLAFLLQPGTISALITMSGLGVLAGVFVRVARAFDPTLGSE